MFQAVILDFDGTLLDTEQHNFRCWQLTARSVGLDLTEDFYRSLVGLTIEDSNQLLRQQFGHDSPLEEWRALRREKFYQLWDDGEGPGWKAGLEVLLPYLQERDLKRAIASSSRKAELDLKLERSQLLDHFPIRVAGDEVAAGKPQPDVFLEAARRLEVEPKDCLVVEDSIMGVIAGRAAGMAVVFVPDMIPPDERVRQQCLAVVSSLDEVIQFLV
ncbi:MAG: HAD family phosphatase [Candidatus Eremiobacteraeota bacterium]|nr:HAD family phosphatase [Candidatus Eremiobacteraeota bacterium]MCW5866165.1 HAD family phosphatase [Candidatus Eremiobacteraeota bacterium]